MDFQGACVTAAGDAADACAGPQAPILKVESASETPVPSFAFIQPLVEHSVPFTGETPINLSQHLSCRLGGDFSFMCTLRMDGIGPWSRIFDFSLTADEDSITAGAIELTQDFHFTVFRGKKPISVRVDGFFELGKEFTMLCTVSASGHMKVFKDGVLVGENRDGMAPLHMDRPRMIVGGHYLFHDQAFRGSLKDVKIWNQELSWEKSEASSAWQMDGEFTSALAEVAIPCESTVDPTSESDEDVELSDLEATVPAAEGLGEAPLSTGTEGGLACQLDTGVALVEGSGDVPLASA